MFSNKCSCGGTVKLKSFLNEILYIIQSYSFIQSFSIHTFFPIQSRLEAIPACIGSEGKGKQPVRHTSIPTRSCSHSHPLAIQSFVVRVTCIALDSGKKVGHPGGMKGENTNPTNISFHLLLSYPIHAQYPCQLDIVKQSHYQHLLNWLIDMSHVFCSKYKNKLWFNGRYVLGFIMAGCSHFVTWVEMYRNENVINLKHISKYVKLFL